jgi:hypothetical protein
MVMQVRPLLHLPLDLAAMSMSGNAGDNSSSFTGGSMWVLTLEVANKYTASIQ